MNATSWVDFRELISGQSIRAPDAYQNNGFRLNDHSCHLRLITAFTYQGYEVIRDDISEDHFYK